MFDQTMNRFTVIGVICVLMALTSCTISPHPLTDEDVRARVVEDLRGLHADQEAVTGPIDLYEAIARSLKYNLESRVKVMQSMLAHQQLDLSHYSLLPQLAANAGYDGRNNFSGGTARSLLTGRQVLEPVTSAERNIFSGNLYLSWDVLDFGLSYVRAQQAADNVLIAQEEKRRQAVRLIQDVRNAFWRAVSAERLLGKVSYLDDQVTKALVNTQMIFDKKLQSPLAPLNYQRDLLNVQREVQRLYRELNQAKVQLASLMNLEPDTVYQLKIPASQRPVPVVNVDIDHLEQQALMNRPELRTIDYQKRVNAKEAKVALLQMFPNLRAQFGGNYSSNSFFFHQNWIGYASQVSWNLLNVFVQRGKQKVIQAQDNVLKAQSLATSMTVLTEVHVGVTQLAYARLELANAERYQVTQVRIADQTQRSWLTRSTSDLNLIREVVNEVLAEVRLDVAHAGLEAAQGNLLAAIGDDAVPTVVPGQGIAELANSIREHWERSELAALSPASTPKDQNVSTIRPVSQ